VVVPANAPASLSIPLKSILDRLPADLQQRVRQHPAADAHISVSMQKILSQFPQGAVKLTFGELRLASPSGMFSVEIDRDRNLVEVPLQEILSRLDSSLLARRPMQRQVVVPPEVTGPFGGQAKVIFSATPLKGATPVQPVTNGNGYANGSNGHTKSFSKTQVTQAAPPMAAPAPLRAAVTTIAPMAAPAPVAFKPVPTTQPAARAPQAQPISPLAPSPVAAPATLRTTTPFTPPPVPQPASALKPVQPIVARIVQPTPALSRVAPAAAPVISPMAPTIEQPTFNRVSPSPVAPVQPVYSPIAPAAELAEPAMIPMSELPAIQIPSEPISPIALAPEPEPEPIRFQMPEPEPVAPIVPIAPVETRFLHVTLGELSAAWPQEIYHEIKALQIASATVALPFGVIEVSLKQGKIALPWRIIRSWVQSPAVHVASPLETTVLELPLKVITPLFIAELRGPKAQKKISIDQTIPDLFSNRQTEPAPAPTAPAPRPAAAPAPRPAAKAAAPAPVTRPADTNYFSKLTPENQPEEAAPVVKQGPTPGTAFLVRYATPNEIVAKAADLPGVDGALIALPDGLLVASRIPPTMNADTIAAFLPQIFGRVSQCTKELRLGELNNLNFTVGNIPWKIFKVGAIYFAAFGRVGEPLPSAQLAAIAAELDRKAK
jgi:predicted regulator of Ras-like GTPase activity (Roadblock/LC7/MglB family)